MNKTRRETIKRAASNLDSVIDMIEDVKSDEEDAIDNMPENLQGSEKYEEMEEYVDKLDSIIDDLNSAKDDLEEFV